MHTSLVIVKLLSNTCNDSNCSKFEKAFAYVTRCQPTLNVCAGVVIVYVRDHESNSSKMESLAAVRGRREELRSRLQERLTNLQATTEFMLIDSVARTKRMWLVSDCMGVGLC